MFLTILLSQLVTTVFSVGMHTSRPFIKLLLETISSLEQMFLLQITHMASLIKAH